MKIVIVGDGKVGSTLAEQLSREGHDITIVDRSPDPLQQTTEDLDILCIEGNGATYETQLEAGVDSADLLIAVTASDELNLLCCLIAKKAGAQHTIARVRNPEYNAELPLITEDLGLSLSVNPELTCATEIARSLRLPSAMRADTFADGHVELLQLILQPDSPLAGKTLMELPSLTRSNVLIGAVQRGEHDNVTIPGGAFRLEAGDRIMLISTPHSAQTFFRQLKLGASRIRQVLIVGGGRIAYYLARQLLESGLDVKIIEKDYSRCEELSEFLPKATILHGDGTNEAFLREAGIAQTDAFASLTGMDEENILMSLYVRKSFPRVKVITKVNRASFQSICRYVRAMQNSVGSKVETLYKLVGGKVEALEFQVAEGSPVCGTPLSTLRLRRNLLIASINRGGKIIIPSGSDTIEPGDTVIVITTITGLSDLGDILDRRKG